MASIITEGINVGAFELIRDRIGLILAEELPNQAIIKDDNELNIQKIWVERFVPFSHTECPAINVSLSDGNYDDKSRLNQHGKYQFFIDIIDKAKTTDENLGGQLASVKVQKITNVCRGILAHHSYNTLAFAKPFVENTKVESIKIGNPGNDKESVNMVMARITFTVGAPENFAPTVPSDIDGYSTKSVLELTDKGYLYGTDSFDPPVDPVCAPVEIRRNGTFLQFVESGGIFNFNTSCEPALVTINSTLISNVPSGGSIIIEVENNDESNVGELIGGKWVVPYSDKIYYNRKVWNDTNYVQDYDEAWHILNGINEYVDNIPVGAKIQNIDYSNLSIKDRLIYKNVYGHFFRFTGVNGGYYNPDDGNYYDLDNNISTKDLQFPKYLSNRYFIIDHLTGFMWIGIRLGTTDFNTNLDYARDLEQGGFSNWIVPSDKVAIQLFDNVYDFNLNATDRPPWSYDQPFHWTCTNNTSNRINNANYFSCFGNILIAGKNNIAANRWVFRVHLNGTIN